MSTLTIYRHDLDRPGKPFRKTVSVHLEMLVLSAGQDEAELYERGRAKLFAKLAELDAYSDRWLDIGSHDIRRGPLFTRITVAGNLQEHEKPAPEGVSAVLNSEMAKVVGKAAAEGLAQGIKDAGERNVAGLPTPGPGIPVSDLVPSWTERYDASVARLDVLKVQQADLIGLCRSVIDTLTGEGGLDERMRRMELALGIAPKVVPDKLVHIGMSPAPEEAVEDQIISVAIFESGLHLFRLEDEALGDFLQRAILQTGA